MTPHEEVEYILLDCFFAMGQTIGVSTRPDTDAVLWWRSRYHEKFLHAMIANGNSWSRDRHRVTAVARFLGQRAVYHADGRSAIDRECAQKASAEIERGCTMNAERERAITAAPRVPHVTTARLD